jgi:hypothetical protein
MPHCYCYYYHCCIHIGYVTGVKKLLHKISQKSLLTFAFAHELLWEYMGVCGPTGIVDVVPVVIDGYMALLSTRSGSRAAALCAAYGGAKDRKRMMKVSFVTVRFVTV